MDTYEVVLPNGACLSDDWYDNHTTSLLDVDEEEQSDDWYNNQEEDELDEED